MRLYLIQFDGESYYVEAPTVARAVQTWTQHVQREWGVDFDGTEEPDSIAMVHEQPVLREATEEKG